MDEFSTDFEAGFLRTLSTVWGVRRVGANKVYNEYIKDKLHVHMNSTVWSTLSLFVEYLGRMGKAIIDKTEEGYFVTYIDRDPEKERRNREAAEQLRLDEDKEQRHAAKLEAEARERAKALDVARAEATGLVRDEAAAPVSVAIKSAKGRHAGARAAGAGLAFGGAAAAAAAAPALQSSASPASAAAGAAAGSAGAMAGAGAAGAPAVGANASGRWGARPDAAAVSASAAAGQEVGGARAPKRQRWESATGDAAATAGGAGPGAQGAALDMAAALKRAKLAAARLAGLAGASAPQTSAAPRLPGMAGMFRDIEAAKRAAEPARAPSSSEMQPGSVAPGPPDGPAGGSAVPHRRMERGAMVRIQNQSLQDGRFHRCKGTVTRVKEAEGAVVVKVRGSEERLVLPLRDVETLVPRTGGQAIGIAGAVSGKRLTVTACDVDAELVSVQVAGSGEAFSGIPFDAVAKLDVDYFESKVASHGSRG